MKPDKHAARRSAILAAAGKMFCDKGFDGATTLDIATEAGVSKRDLYAVFPTKDQILAGLIESSVERYSTPVQFADPKSRAEVLATLQAFGRGFVTFLLGPEPTSLYRLAIAVAERNPGPGKALVSAGVDGTVGRLTTYVRAATFAGHLSLEDVDSAVAAYFNMAIGHLQMRRLLEPTSEIAAAEIDANVQRAVQVLLSFEAR
jgi:TetR/AcrR family transcriptional regulator, mexJK operon transcriptional repressor